MSVRSEKTAVVARRTAGGGQSAAEAVVARVIAGDFCSAADLFVTSQDFRMLDSAASEEYCLFEEQNFNFAEPCSLGTDSDLLD